MARKDKLQQLADDLEKNLDQQEEIIAVLSPYQEKEKEIRAELMDTMQKKGWKFARATSGLGFGITQGRKTFAVKKGMEETALEWAKTNFPSILTLSASKLAQIVKPMLTPPEFIEEKVGDPYLTVRQQEADETN